MPIKSRPFCNRPCWLVFGMLVFGLMAIMCGLVYVITNPVAQATFSEQFVISSNTSKGYVDWVCKYTRPSTDPADTCYQPYDEVEQYEYFYMFNLTNPDEVKAGATPRYVELGGYAYRRTSEKFDIEFLDEGNRVRYMEKTDWVYTAGKSCVTCLDTDNITNINPYYLTAVTTAGGEANYLRYLGGPAVNNLLTKLNTSYLARTSLSEEALINLCVERGQPCTSLDDVVLMQWGYLNCSNPDAPVAGLLPAAAHDFDNAAFPHDVTELWTVAPLAQLCQQTEDLNLSQLRDLFDGDSGIRTHPTKIRALLTALENGTAGALAPWNLPSDVAPVLLDYLNGLNATYGRDLYNTLEASGGGLITSRSVRTWIIGDEGFVDPIVALFADADSDPAVLREGFRHHDTSNEDARTYKLPWEMYTGLNNSDEAGPLWRLRRQIAQIILWENSSTVDYWAQPLVVAGNVQDGQYMQFTRYGNGKYADEQPDIPAWSRDHARTVILRDTGIWTDIDNIVVRRFTMADDTYGVDPLYYQFVQGFANVSAYRMGPPFRKRNMPNIAATTPIFLSNPRLWRANATYAAKVELNVPPSADACETIVDIEPYTGNAMRSARRVQVNYYLEPGLYDAFHPTAPADVFYPFHYSNVEATITLEHAANWEDTVGWYILMEQIIFILGLSLGCTGFVLCCIAYNVRGRKPEYQAIN